jgi:hypothetical protein
MATGRIGVTPTLGVRWSKAPAGGTTSLSGLDDNSVSLVYSVGYEQVYRNGVLLSRTNDYTATTGNSITLIDATIAGDIIEVFANELVPLTDAISKGQFTAKGALLSATAASTPGVLTVGSNDQVLTADSSTATGLKWATAGGGMTLISETVASAVTGIDLTSISGSYKQLLLVWDGIEHSTTGSGFSIRFNSDSGSNYIDNAFMYQSGGVGAQIGTGANSSIMSNDTNQQPFGYETANSNNYTICARGHLYIDNYASTSKYKLYYGQFSHQKSGIGLYYNLLHGAYKSTSAITSINIIRVSGSATISNLTNSSIRLYGIS